MFKKKILASLVVASFLIPTSVEAAPFDREKSLNKNMLEELSTNLELDYLKNPIVSLNDFKLEKNVVITIGEEEIKLKTKEYTIENLLKSIGINLKEEDVVIPSIESKIKDGDEILILAHTSKISYEIEEENFATNKVFTIDLDLGDRMVETKGVPKLTKTTILEESKNGVLINRVNVNRQVIQEKIDEKVIVGAREEVKEKIPFEIISKENSYLEEGISKVVKKGSEGELVKTYYNDGVKRELIEENIEKEPVTQIVEIGTKKEVSVLSKSNKLYTLKEFMFHGVIRSDNKKYTYYSQSVLPGRGLSIPGRHVSKEGYVSDKDGYIVLASSASIKKGSVIDTPFGSKGKVYDVCASCDPSWFDVYVK